MSEPDRTDGDLVELAKARSAEAFLLLVRRYKGIVAAAVYTLIPDRHEVDEIVEDAFADAWGKLGELRAAWAFGGWVRKIARRLALKRLRARVRARGSERAVGGRGGAGRGGAGGGAEGGEAAAAAEEVAAGPGSDPSEQLAIRDLYERIALEMSRLPSVYRDAIGMRYFDGLTCKEIQATLGLPLGTVTMRLSRGSRLLKARLGAALKDYLEG